LKLSAYAHSIKEMAGLKKSGFEYVTLHSSLFPTIELGMLPNKDQIKAVKDALKENDLIPTDVATFFTWTSLGLSGMMEQLPSSPLDPEYEAARKRGVVQYRELIKICRQLGVKQIYSLMGGRRLFHLDHQEAWLKSVRDLRSTLESEGITLAFMPHPGDFIENSDEAVDLIRSTKCKKLGYVYVVPHTFIMSGRMKPDPAAMIRYAAKAGVLTEVHMADSLHPVQMWVRDHFDIDAYHNHLIPGRGSVDIKAVLKTLVSIRFDGPVVMIPYRYGVFDKSYTQLSTEAKRVVERMLKTIR
jgi:sugar phosphate isomerase/epimerase